MGFLSVASTLGLPPLLFSSIWILYNSTAAARLLLNYEDVTKKAAKVTSIAADQLHRTRMTQGAGVVASLSTTVSALLAIYWSFSTGNSAHQSLFLLGGVNVGLCLWVQRYMAAFWAGSGRSPIPGTTDYNDAVRSTEQVMKWLRIVALGWAGIMAVNLG